jgi:class 3 adenylate cyclase
MVHQVGTSGSGSEIRSSNRLTTHFHVRDVLGSVHVPTLVVHRKGEAIPIEYAREVAAGIPSARLVELEGIDHWPTFGDIKSITGEIEEFLTGQRQAHLPDRVLATVLFTDIVDSTRHAARLGDRTWRELLARHDEVTHAEITRFQGRVVQHTGDGFLAAFDGPTRALRCATTVAERMPELGIDVRCGLHTGECEIRGEDIGGIAVHIGARVSALAQAGEVLVSSTVKDLVNGSGIAFIDRAPTCSRAYRGSGSSSRRQAKWRPSITTYRSSGGGFKRSWQIASAADRDSLARCCGCPTGAEIGSKPRASRLNLAAHNGLG